MKKSKQTWSKTKKLWSKYTQDRYLNKYILPGLMVAAAIVFILYCLKDNSQQAFDPDNTAHPENMLANDTIVENKTNKDPEKEEQKANNPEATTNMQAADAQDEVLPEANEISSEGVKNKPSVETQAQAQASAPKKEEKPRVVIVDN